MALNKIISYLPTSKHILVIGDVILDEFIYGQINKVNPEAAAHVVNVSRRTIRAGGAANVAVNVSQFCKKVSLIGHCGNDHAGRQLTGLLEEYGITCHLLKRDRPTIKKTRVLVGSQQICRFDEEELIEQDILSSTLNVRNLLKSVDIVVLSDYAKGSLFNCNNIIRMCVELNIPVLVDPKGIDFEKYDGADVVKPNLKEFLVAANLTDKYSNIDLDKEILKFHGSLNIKFLLVTCGDRGMILSDKEKIVRVPSLVSKIYDVTGAGDSVIAALSSVLLEDVSLLDKVKFGNLVAGIAVGEPSTYAVTLEDIKQNMLKQKSTKNLSLQSITELVEILRRQGKRIVFTNGCFDILHRGHIQSLKMAKSFGDYLIVGLNKDASVEQNKGSSRPILSFDDRCAVLESLEFVDAVIGFEEKTPLNLIKGIRPDVLVKGKDYSTLDVVGSNFLAPGGEIKLVDLVDGVSTTQIIEKIRGVC